LPAWLDSIEDFEQEEPAMEELEEAPQKRNLAALAKSNLYPKNHKLYHGQYHGKRSLNLEDVEDQGWQIKYSSDGPAGSKCAGNSNRLGRGRK
jgi:hypothetical protein